MVFILSLWKKSLGENLINNHNILAFIVFVLNVGFVVLGLKSFWFS